MGTSAPAYVQRLHCLVSLNWAGARQQELLSLLITPNLSKITLGHNKHSVFLRLFLRAMLLKKLVYVLPLLFLSLFFLAVSLMNTSTTNVLGPGHLTSVIKEAY